MCSFLFARTSAPPSDAVLAEANRRARHRGPDASNVLRRIDGAGMHITYLHNLLDISGTSRQQPLTEAADDAGNVALFNGEIYNHRDIWDSDCDSDCILPRYREVGEQLAREVDGEYSIVIHDWERNSAFLFCDPFLTKPLYLGYTSHAPDFGAATCASSLQAIGFDRIEMAEPNTAYRIDFTSAGIVETRTSDLVSFSLEQHREDYAAWTEAFMRAVRKRAEHGRERPAVFLSSGYDSGAICLALNVAGIAYDTFSIDAGEDAHVLDQRIRLNLAASCEAAYRLPGLPPDQVDRVAHEMASETEHFLYQHEDAPGAITSLHADQGALGAHVLAGFARSKRRVVNLSGTGADEILSDYGFAGTKFYFHSEFGGLFPEDLTTIFPWKKFYGDTQRSYLFKDEFVLGRHGVEGRYPFLDKQLVQEFLSLSAALKNRTYKAPLEHFLLSHGYPFEPLRKRGFSPVL